jgi:transcription antitermination protein NusB
MPARHRSRQKALQVLFSWDQRRQNADQAIQDFYATLGSEEDEPTASPRDEFMEALVRGTSAHAQDLDKKIAAKSDNWRLDRMPAVDRNILRLAVYEMTALGTPPAIVINEAVELARQFSGDESGPFINGVLDAVRRDGEDGQGSASQGSGAGGQ